MPYIIVRHKVTDYDVWKPVYDEDAANRKAHGSKGIRLFRNANDPSEFIALAEFGDLEDAHAFTESPELREHMERAGVSDRPDIYFLDEIERAPY